MKKGNWKKRGMAIILAAAVAAGAVQIPTVYAEEEFLRNAEETGVSEVKELEATMGRDLRETTAEGSREGNSDATIPEKVNDISTKNES